MTANAAMLHSPSREQSRKQQSEDAGDPEFTLSALRV